jgi:flavin reductase (DIM6/NTAB) family NADH-FMN oxidoreductase RutF
MQVDPRAYRHVMGRLATGVTVLTTRGPDRHEVMTANAITSVSLDPVLLLASIGRGCRWGAAVRDSGSFVVNVLSAEQDALSRWCADSRRHDEPDVLGRHASRISSGGGLVFEESLAAFECRLYDDIPMGDHDLVVGEVQDMWVRDRAEPLLFYAGTYASLGALVPTSAEPLEALSA